VIKEPGWTVLEANAATDKKPNDDFQQPLPPLAEGQAVAKRSAQIKQGKTAAPKPYDDASLLTAMKNAGQEIEDQDLAAHMKQTGLGTPATRAAIIEKLIASGCIGRRRKSLLPTEKGKALVSLVHPTLKDVAMTASWEQQLAHIQDGTESAESFAHAITQFLRNIFPEILAL
jgi:DNA topoisomerase-3